MPNILDYQQVPWALMIERGRLLCFASTCLRISELLQMTRVRLFLSSWSHTKSRDISFLLQCTFACRRHGLIITAPSSDWQYQTSRRTIDWRRNSPTVDFFQRIAATQTAASVQSSDRLSRTTLSKPSSRIFLLWSLQSFALTRCGKASQCNAQNPAQHQQQPQQRCSIFIPRTLRIVSVDRSSNCIFTTLFPFYTTPACIQWSIARLYGVSYPSLNEPNSFLMLTLLDVATLNRHAFYASFIGRHRTSKLNFSLQIVPIARCFSLRNSLPSFICALQSQMWSGGIFSADPFFCFACADLITNA